MADYILLAVYVASIFGARRFFNEIIQERNMFTLIVCFLPPFNMFISLVLACFKLSWVGSKISDKFFGVK